jgi:hypothetical protein
VRFGNNIPVFFIQDAMKFPDLVRAVKMEADRGLPGIVPFLTSFRFTVPRRVCPCRKKSSSRDLHSRRIHAISKNIAPPSATQCEGWNICAQH